MEEGSLRCDANISVRKKGETKYNTRVEVKNMNSFRNVQRAIEYEAQRQIELIESGKQHTIIQETRNFDPNTGKTAGMRTKENLNDYRYFPEPDLTPVIISDAWLERIQKEMPALPKALFEKFTKQYKLSEYDALVLIESKEIALYFEGLAEITTNYKQACNWVTTEIKGYLNEMALSLEKFPLKPSHIAQIIALVQQNKVSHSIASQKIFPILVKNPEKTAEEIAKAENLLLDNDADALKSIVEEVVKMFPEKVKEYQAGKKGLLGMFMGEIMKKTKGKADPKTTSQILSEALDNHK
jgi:aspartyl-tRNA(Asn)/glutamyl-tRNA(Gln) amidotransferase subunit B